MKDNIIGKKIDPSAANAITAAVKSIVPMSDSDMELLMSILENRTIKKHEYLLKEGEVSQNVYFLIDGFFRMYYIDHTGSEINYRFTDRNNFFVDFQSFVTQKPSHFYWQAMENSEMLALPYNKIQDAYASSPAWSNFGRHIAEHVYLQLNERVEMLLFMSPEERYLHLLKTRPQIFTQVSQFHLSSYLGIKPESLSRLRKRLLRH
ncbi:MAG: Crp/Fnr family transcriptional regulator [Cyclobacteriaceae bacterium]